MLIIKKIIINTKCPQCIKRYNKYTKFINKFNKKYKKNTIGYMNKKQTLPKIIFYGTPEFARFCLEKLVVEGFPILAVVTAPDRKAGRGKK